MMSIKVEIGRLLNPVAQVSALQNSAAQRSRVE